MKNKNKQQCQAQTKRGTRCRAWAIRGTERCSAHSQRNKGAGAPKHNQNAVKHGFYGRFLTDEEIVDLITITEKSIDDELALVRVTLQRLLSYLSDPDVTAEDATKIAPMVFTGARTVAQLLRSNRALSGDAADGIAGAIAQALDEIGTELGIEL